MVSITFDEFHALRSRQRATTAAQEVTASKSSASANASSPSQKSSESNGRQPKGSVFTAQYRQPGRSSTEKRGTPADGESSDVQEVAPTSGSNENSADRDKHSHSTLPGAASIKYLHCQQYAPSSAVHSSLGLQDTNATEAKPRKATSQRQASWGLSAAALGRFVELYEVQVAIVTLIAMDLVACTAQLLPFLQSQTPLENGSIEENGAHHRGSSTAGGAWTRLALRILQSFTGFTVIVFGLEVAVLLTAFRGKVFRHLGYVVDLAVVTLCLLQELAGLGKELRLLGALRIWRVTRVIGTLLHAADEDHGNTRALLVRQENRTLELEADQRRLQETLRREIETRRRVDKMLRGYKDEVDTLNEALKIAAMDIARARASDSLEELGAVDDVESVGESNAEDRTPSLSSDAGKSGGRTGTSDQREEEKISPSIAATGQIYVFQDGTFKAR